MRKDREARWGRVGVLHWVLFFFLLACPLGRGEEVPALLAIIDTGVCPSHITPENARLGDAFVLESGWDFVAGELLYQDDAGHGTHMSGIVWRQLQGLRAAAGEATEGRPALCMLRAGVGNLDPGHLVAALQRLEADLEAGRKVSVVLCSFSLERKKTSSKLFGEFRGLLESLLSKGVVIVSATNGAGANLDALSEEESYLPGCLEHPNLLTIAACSDRGFPAPRASVGKERVFASAVGRNVRSLWPKGQEKTLSGSSQAAALVAAEAYHLLNRKQNPVRPEDLRKALPRQGRFHPALLGQTATGCFFAPVQDDEADESRTSPEPENR